MAVGEDERASAPTERSPLLSTPAPPSESTRDGKEQGEKPLDLVQIGLLCLAKAPEGFAFFSIFAFINQMVYETGIPAAQCGFYTGLIESLFSLVQFCIMPVWGRLSDKKGRKPLLVMSLCGLAVTSCLFGLARNVWQMMVLRCLSGFFSASGVTIRTMISEHSTPKTQARAFSLLSFSGNISIFLAPLLGGGLAKPADSFPVFKHVPLFVSYPYLLPCLVTGVLAGIAGVVDLIWLKETLKPTEKGSTSAPELSTREILASPGVGPVLAIYLWTFALAYMYTALIPVFWFTPVELGGYGFSPKQISYLLAVGGLGQAVWTLFVFPPLHARVGSRGVLRAAAATWCLMFALYPAMNLSLRHGISRAAFWTIAVACALLSSGISMSFTSVQLCVNDIAPGPGSLGTLNGVALAWMAGTRAVAPALITTVFAAGVERQVMHGQLAWALLLVVAAGYNAMVRYLPKKAEGIVKRRSSSLAEEEGE